MITNTDRERCKVALDEAICREQLLAEALQGQLSDIPTELRERIVEDMLDRMAGRNDPVGVPVGPVVVLVVRGMRAEIHHRQAPGPPATPSSRL